MVIRVPGSHNALAERVIGVAGILGGTGLRRAVIAAVCALAAGLLHPGSDIRGGLPTLLAGHLRQARSGSVQRSTQRVSAAGLFGIFGILVAFDDFLQGGG